MTKTLLKYSLPAAIILLAACGGASEDPGTTAAAEAPDQSASLTSEETDGGESEAPQTPPESDVSEQVEYDEGEENDRTAELIEAGVLAEDGSLEPSQEEIDAALEEIDAQNAAASGAGAEKIMIVMDGSGSMWGQIDGKTKIEIAREALETFAYDLPEDAPAGLIAYGHRKKGDCEDIEVIMAPTVGNRAEIVGEVEGITPIGKTPLSAAVELAADTLKYEEDAATVILITDGIETCDVDPCELGLTLEERGINFTTHIVGFGLSEQEGRQVACLAENTGGYYIEASNADELSGAMEQVAEVVEADDPVPEPELAEATLTVPEEVEIGSVFEVTWTGPENDDGNDYLDMADVERGEKVGKYINWHYTHDRDGKKKDLIEMRAPVELGEYQVRYVWANPPHAPKVIASETFNVIDAEVALSAPERVNVGQMFEVTWKGPMNKNDYVDLVPKGQTATNTQLAYRYTNEGKDGAGVVELQAPTDPAETELRYVTRGSDGKRVLKTIPLIVEDVRVEVAFNPSVAMGSTLDVSWTGPNNMNDYIDIVERGFEDTNTQLTYAYTKNGNPAELKVPGDAGEYDVRYVMRGTDGKRVMYTAPLTLTEVGATVEFTPDLQVGDLLEVEWTGPNTRNDYIDIVERGFDKTNTQLAYQYTKTGNPVEMKVPANPGDYDVRYIMQSSTGKRILATEPLTLADHDVSLTFDTPVRIGQIVELEWEGPAGHNNYVDMVEEGFRKTNAQLTYVYARKSGEILELKPPAEPGSYDIRFILSGSDGERVMYRETIEVEDVATSIDAATSAAAGSTIEAEWDGPGGYNDYLDVVPRGKKLPKDSIHYAYTRHGDVLELKMPDDAGEYDIRYIHVGPDKRVVKARVPIDVE